MPTKVSAPLPELDWPTLTVIEVDAGDPNAVVESLIILVSEDAPEMPEPAVPDVTLFSYTGNGTESPGLTRG